MIITENSTKYATIESVNLVEEKLENYAKLDLYIRFVEKTEN